MTEGAEHGINWLPELVKFLNLAVIIGAIYYFAGKAISAALKNRSLDISKKIVDAKAELEKMQYEAEKARREIADIGKVKEKMLAEMREEGLKTYEAMVADAKNTAERIKADAKLAADNEVVSAIGRVKKDIVDRAVNQALSMVNEGSGSDAKGRLHERLVDKFIGQLQEKEGMGHGL